MLEEILTLSPEAKTKFFHRKNLTVLKEIIKNTPLYIDSVIPLLAEIPTTELKEILGSDTKGNNVWLNAINSHAPIETKKLFFKELSRLKFTEQYMILKSYTPQCKIKLEQGIEQLNLIPLKKHLKLLLMDSQAKALDILEEIKTNNSDYDEVIHNELNNKMSPLSQALSVKKGGFFKNSFDRSLLSIKVNTVNLP